MNLSRVDLNLFVVFEAIFTLGSITAAGSKLNLSQSAVSHALQRLRIVFDDQLFERNNRGMAPTPLARALIGDVRTALQRMEGTLRRTGHFDPSTTQRKFTIAMAHPFDSFLLPPLMERIGLAAPGIDVGTVYSDRRRVEAAVMDGSFDAAVDVLMPMSPAISHLPVLSDPMVVLARHGHPAIQGSLDLDTYLAQEHVLVSSRRRGPGIEDMALRRHGLSRHIRLRCENYGAACKVINRTDMLLTLPLSFTRVADGGAACQILPPPFSVPPLELFLYWNVSMDGDAAGRWFREQVLQAVLEIQTDETRAA